VKRNFTGRILNSDFTLDFLPVCLVAQAIRQAFYFELVGTLRGVFGGYMVSSSYFSACFVKRNFSGQILKSGFTFYFLL